MLAFIVGRHADLDVKLEQGKSMRELGQVFLCSLFVFLCVFVCLICVCVRFSCENGSRFSFCFVCYHRRTTHADRSFNWIDET
jgi:hypothetical protein